MLRKKLKLDRNNDVVYTTDMSIIKDMNATESAYFQKQFWQRVYDIQCDMNLKFETLHFDKPVAAVYNPTVYAEELHCAYLKQYLNETKHVLFLGMNPGPWGMCQTGVPFGYIPAVRDWLKLEGRVNKPNPELPARPVTGLDCDKSEQSGQRFWGLLEKLCGTPENLFRHCFIHNYCALAFFAPTGRNITPYELRGDIKRQLQDICNNGLIKTLELISPSIIVCIGTYIHQRVLELKKKKLIDEKIEVICMPHPSPRSLHNVNWVEKAEKWLIENNLIQYFNN